MFWSIFRFHFYWIFEQIFGKTGQDSRYQLRLQIYNAWLEQKIWTKNQILQTEQRSTTYLTKADIKNLPSDRPILFKGLARSINFDEISAEKLIHKYGTTEQPTYSYEDQGANFKTRTLKEIISNIQTESKDAESLLFGDIFHRFPDLLKALRLESWTESSFFQKVIRLSYHAFISPKDAKTKFHTEITDIFNVQLWGEKKWLLISAEDSYKLIPDVTRTIFLMTNHCNIPDAFMQKPLNIKAWECELEPGDVLYFPSFMWHYVETTENSFSVGIKWHEVKTLFRHPFLSTLVFSSRRPPILKILALMFLRASNPFSLKSALTTKAKEFIPPSLD